MPWFLTLFLSAAVFYLHYLLAPILPLGVDEAHYALYGKHLALGYFDHPPMVGWLQALVLLFSKSELALRLLAMVFFFLSALVLHSLTKQLYPSHGRYTPTLAVLLLSSMPLLHLLGMAMVPDVPLLLFGLLSIKFTHLALTENKNRHWLLLAIFLGLAGLTKYSAIVLVITIVLLVFYHRQWFNGKLYLTALLALVMITPVIYWNYQHDFISLFYQLKHGADVSNQWRLDLFLKSQLTQLIVFSPLIYGLSWWLITRCIYCRENHWPMWWFLPNILLFVWASGFEFSLPHWSTLAWVSLLPMLAAHLSGLWQKKRNRYWLGGGFLLSVLLVASVYLALLDRLPFTIKPQPLRDLIGWQYAAEHAARLNKQLAKQYQVQNSVIFVDHWTKGSRIKWYSNSAVEVLDNRFDQFDIWQKGQANAGVLISNGKISEHPAFAHCQLLDSYFAYTPRQQQLINRFYFYWCQR